MADTSAQDVAALRAELAQVRATLARFEHQQQQTWLSQRQTEEVKALVHEVLADADARASLLQEGATAGWQNGFFLKSPDVNNLLRIGGVIKPRYVLNHQSDPPVTDPDATKGGFEMTCSRFSFSGHVIDPTWNYLFIMKVGNTGTISLLDAYVRKDLGHGLTLAVGQFKSPFMIEDDFSEVRQQFVDRSLVTARMGVSYTQGLLLSWTAADWLRLHGSFNDGARRINQPWNTPDTEFAFTGRAEWKLAGDWKQYNEFESWIDSDRLIVLGAAAHYEDGEFGAPGDKARSLRWTADAMLGMGGWNLFGAIVGNHLDNRSGPDLNQLGAVVQGGVFVNDKFELIARYEWGDSDIDGEDHLSIATAGFNYFILKHAAKFTFDIGYAFNGVGPSWSVTGLGWRTDAPGEDGQIVVRAQFQLVF